MQKIIPNKAAMLQHLQFLFSNAGDYRDGKIEIAFTPSTTGAVNNANYFEIDELEKAAEFAYQKNSQDGVNVYIGAALRDPNVAPFGRSNINDFYVTTSIWVDLDDADAAKTAKEKYSKLPPSFIVVTGRTPNLRAQCWWHIMHPETNKEALNDNLAFICASLGGDRAVVDPIRVMRLGGSIAWPKKSDRIPEVTEIIIPENNTKMVMLDHFKSYFPNAAPSLLTATKAQASGGVGRNVITNTINIPALLEQSRNEGHWHVSMRDAIAAMVAKGWSDEQIRIATNPYRRDRSLIDDLISPLIGSARKKWDIPEPQTGANPEQYDPITGVVHKPKTIFYTLAKDIKPSIEANDFVQGVLGNGHLSVVYGESNCGKTFFMTDLAFHVALGKEWRGKRVEQGAVIYAALEGSYGLRNRIAAYRQHNVMLDKNMPLAMISSQLDFLNPKGNIDEFLETIFEIEKEIGKPRLIVIDTLARALMGGDENSGQDMGAIVYHADKIRELSGAHVSFVHHSGKDAAKGARGHSSLRAAVDTEIEISREKGKDFSLIKFVKQREMEMADDMAFTLKAVVLGQNQYGEDVTSCVVEPCEIVANTKSATLTPKQQFVFDAIVESLLSCGQVREIHKDMPRLKCITYDQLREQMENQGFRELYNDDDGKKMNMTKSATQSAREALKKKNKISFNKDYIWLLNYDE